MVRLASLQRAVAAWLAHIKTRQADYGSTFALMDQTIQSIHVKLSKGQSMSVWVVWVCVCATCVSARRDGQCTQSTGCLAVRTQNHPDALATRHSTNTAQSDFATALEGVDARTHIYYTHNSHERAAANIPIKLTRVGLLVTVDFHHRTPYNWLLQVCARVCVCVSMCVCAYVRGCMGALGIGRWALGVGRERLCSKTQQLIIVRQIRPKGSSGLCAFNNHTRFHLCSFTCWRLAFTRAAMAHLGKIFVGIRRWAPHKLF